ncbi:unnamed protein product [Blepharisma stoltei]|uniref:CSD domain-containing protein n=1 Tax=Blepharisma stoltei TaxID=1481888 RepID=A0AAU9JKY2_9CILI|nr:unnamed protein product [Blepharisma stoltei]
MSHALPPSRTLHSPNGKHTAESSDLQHPKLSPAGRNPSTFTQGPKKPQNIFFNASISISQLKVMGDIDVIDEEVDESPENNKNCETNKSRIDNKKNKSSSPNSEEAENIEGELLKVRKIDELLPLEKTPPPPGFEKPKAPKKKFNWSEVGYDSDFTPTPVSEIKPMEKIVNHIEISHEPVVLQAPPLKPAILKRKIRGNFEAEKVSGIRHTGILKFYQLKKRFGFISMDDNSKDVFLCEDDLILSGVNHKKFKQDVYNKVPVHLSFLLKEYEEKGQLKRKAVEILVIESNNSA